MDNDPFNNVEIEFFQNHKSKNNQQVKVSFIRGSDEMEMHIKDLTKDTRYTFDIHSDYDSMDQ